MRNRFRKQHFTLTEMMVVIVIILILFMLLLPGLNEVRETAKRISCLNRLKETTAQSLLAAQNNDNRLLFSGAIHNPIKFSTDNARFQKGVMLHTRPEVVFWAHEAWRVFVCTNVLPQWNGPSSSNRGGYPNAKDAELTIQEWESVDPGGASRPPWFDSRFGKEGEDQGPIYVLGSFNTNVNGPVKSLPPRAEGVQDTVPEMGSYLSLIPSPSKRVYIMEEGESSNHPQANIKFLDYSQQVTRGVNGEASIDQYIPGMGGGGIGKEKMEKIGFAESEFEVLPPERYDLIKKDVFEGRHNGYTLHGFFDGHVEAVPVEIVGSLQRGKGDTLADLKGIYGDFGRAADDD